MAVDVSELLREFGLSILEGEKRAVWLLHGADGERIQVEPTAPISHLNAHTVRRLTLDGRSRLLVGETAAAGVVRQALAGQVDILIAHPPRLIHAGHEYSIAENIAPPLTRPRSGRVAWTRWTIERYLILATEPSKQGEIAETAQTTQQSVSNTALHLAELVTVTGDGLVATNRAGLLEHWFAEYAGPGGLQLGWYSLDPVLQQTKLAIEAAELLGVQALVSGDVAADSLAPWKRPARGRLYLDGPVDLEQDGFVPAPLDEATLVTCIPVDPSLWRLINLRPAASTTGSLPLADPAIVYWDLKTSGEVDSDEAAEHLAAVAIGRTL